MKKLLALLLALMMVLSLGACGSKDTQEPAADDSTAETGNTGDTAENTDAAAGDDAAAAETGDAAASDLQKPISCPRS